MADNIKLGLRDNINRCLKIIAREIKKLQQSGISISFDKDIVDNTVFIKIFSTQHWPNHYIEEIKNFTVEVTAKILTEVWHKEYIKEKLDEEYYYFNDREKKGILKIYNKLIDEDDCYNDGIKTNSVVLYNKLHHIIFEHFQSHDELILEGFITFRLKSYCEELDDLLEKAVEEYVMEREYREFIRLLKYFVDIQEPKLDVINVFLCNNERGFILLDSELNTISKEYINEIEKEGANNNINGQDLLISLLITIAPNKIIVHSTNKKDKDVIETINNIFFDRVHICSGCKLCAENIALNKGD